MARFLIIAGVILVLAGLAWPFIAKLGLGRLPGDIVFHPRQHHVLFPDRDVDYFECRVERGVVAVGAVRNRLLPLNCPNYCIYNNHG